ncbi:MAG: hypothetical protein JRI23_01705 [Deltaproteobacteria bacterium]|jgi:hypothetical protein|nr:hypothetical protein [Deltaproteobacteria bacterium]MBW2530182.1 hypothetical protein [Deltaproteobacteria bacterium]
MADRPTVYVCSGKRCSDHPKRHKQLVRTIEEEGRVVDCGCVKICHGPVAGLEIDGQLEWFRGLHSHKSIERFRKLVEKGKLSKSLEKRRVSKRRGKKPPT